MSEILRNTYTRTVKLRYEIDTALNECHLTTPAAAPRKVSKCKEKVE